MRNTFTLLLFVLFIALLLALVSVPARSSHIVGGQFELLHLRENMYRLNLIVYSDLVHGQAGTKDESSEVQIYRKRDNALMTTVILLLEEETDVTYSYCDLHDHELETGKWFYTATLSLPAHRYDDEAGYYVSFQRCCRNYSITNIYSEDPGPNPGNPASRYAGQTFYLEFPPVVKDGTAFINSSPRSFQPLYNFACPGIPYYADFSGVDDDGDSLAYSLLTPFNTTAPQPVSVSPGPYPKVEWKPGYSIDRITGGDPELTINSKGILSFGPPTQTGLYVFSVRVEQYRNKVKIGESFLDYQIPVRTDCPTSKPPLIQGKNFRQTQYADKDSMTVSFPASTPNQERCIRVKVTDPDASGGTKEKVSIKAVWINGDTSNQILPEVKEAEISNGNAAEFTICFPKCPVAKKQPALIRIVAIDDACPFPLADTLYLQVTIDPSNSPVIDSDLTEDDQETEAEASVKLFEPVRFRVTGTDLDVQQKLSLKAEAATFTWMDNMSFTPIEGNSPLSSLFSWTPDCSAMEMIESGNSTIRFVVLEESDPNVCPLFQSDTLLVRLNIEEPNNTPSVFSIDPAPSSTGKNQDHLTYKIGQPISINVYGTDSDINPYDTLLLSLRDAPDGVQAGSYTFNPAKGLRRISSVLRWQPDCLVFPNEESVDVFPFSFRLTAIKCNKRFHYDTLVNIQVADIPFEDTEFTPPSIITPNQDGCNDYFALEGLDEPTCGPRNFDIHFPTENCQYYFKSILIINRWGKRMFFSRNKNFRWHANQASSGVYYYYLDFAKKVYKGSLVVRP